MRPVRDPWARTPRRILRGPFEGLRHRCERVRCGALKIDAARPGRLGARRGWPVAPSVRRSSSVSPSVTGRRRIAFFGSSGRMDLLVVARGIPHTVRRAAAGFPMRPRREGEGRFPSPQSAVGNAWFRPATAEGTQILVLVIVLVLAGSRERERRTRTIEKGNACFRQLK